MGRGVRWLLMGRYRCPCGLRRIARGSSITGFRASGRARKSRLDRRRWCRLPLLGGILSRCWFCGSVECRAWRSTRSRVRATVCCDDAPGSGGRGLPLESGVVFPLCIFEVSRYGCIEVCCRGGREARRRQVRQYLVDHDARGGQFDGANNEPRKDDTGRDLQNEFHGVMLRETRRCERGAVLNSGVSSHHAAPGPAGPL